MLCISKGLLDLNERVKASSKPDSPPTPPPRLQHFMCSLKCQEKFRIAARRSCQNSCLNILDYKIRGYDKYIWQIECLILRWCLKVRHVFSLLWFRVLGCFVYFLSVFILFYFLKYGPNFELWHQLKTKLIKRLNPQEHIKDHLEK
jgi:hypothetical protein